MNANQVTDTAAEAQPPREVEFLTLLLKVRPEDRLSVLSELRAIAETGRPDLTRP